MLHKQSMGSRIFDVVNIFFMVLLVFIMIYPLWYVLSISISDSAAVTLGRVRLFPMGFDYKAYTAIFKTSDLPVAYKNTIIYTCLSTFLVVFFCSIAAYPLSKRDLYGKRIITFLMALTMIFPAGIIPKFLLMKDIGLLDSIWALVLPPAFSVWYMVLIRTNFQALPESLIESAHIEGAGEWRVLFQIVLPLSKPIIATVALFAAVSQWNSFFPALLYLNDPEKYPLQMILRKVITAEAEHGLLEGYGAEGSGFIQKVKMATIIVSIGPIIIVYPFVQKYFIKGTMVGSVKG